MAVRVGINGMGRIGRSFWRVAQTRPDLEVVAVNDLGDPAMLAHLLRYDTPRGRLGLPVTVTPDWIVVDGSAMHMWRYANPSAVPWRALGVAVVLESTGRFFRATEVSGHLAGGARRVLTSMAAPDPDVTVIPGINTNDFDPARHRIVSPACCISNAVAPILAALRTEFELLDLHLTTIHAYDGAPRDRQDSPHRNLRMGRAGAVNMVPGRVNDTTRALERVFPDLAGRIDGLAMRVPVGIGCAADLVIRLGARVTSADVNAVLARAAAGRWRGYLGYTEEPIVSSDVTGAAESSIVDGLLTTVVGNSVKIIAWYDNEWGFSHRLADVAALIG